MLLVADALSFDLHPLQDFVSLFQYDLFLIQILILLTRYVRNQEMMNILSVIYVRENQKKLFIYFFIVYFNTEESEYLFFSIWDTDILYADWRGIL